MNTERLLKLADGLDILPPEKFNYEMILDGHDMPRATFDCGTTGCAIGWGPVFLPDLLKYASDGDGGYVVVSCETGMELHVTSSHASDALKDFFDVTREEAVGLFCPEAQFLIQEEALEDNATPKEVADLIRRFSAKATS